MARTKITPDKLDQIRQSLSKGDSVRTAARTAGVHHSTAMRALKRSPRKVRTAAEFASTETAKHPLRQAPIGSWNLESIRSARDAQMRGDFKQPVRLAEAMRTESAIYTARLNRMAPHSAISSTLEPSDKSTRAEAVAKAAASSVTMSRTMLSGALGTLADHGIAILQIKQEARGDGTRVDFRVEEWPLEHVKWNTSLERLETRSKCGGGMIPIVHGDGEWVVIRKFETLPWTQDACLLPGAMIWAGLAYGLADWAQATRSHGQAKMAGKLGPGVALEVRNEAGEIVLSPEARWTLQTLQDMVSGEAGAGIFPANTEVDFLANGSTAWQVFKEFVQDREKSSARIYNGTDAAMGASGGAPGVDISMLFGVASTIVQGDLMAISVAVNSGVYAPWTAINYGDSRYSPSLTYQIPDPDSGRKLDEDAKRHTALVTMVSERKANGLLVDQAVVDHLAQVCGVSPAPTLAQLQAPTQPMPPVPAPNQPTAPSQDPA